MISIFRLCELFAVMIVLGSMASLPLYGWSVGKLLHSELFIKILFWIPIFGLFVIVLDLPNTGRLVAVLVLISMAAREAIREGLKKPIMQPTIMAYFGLYCLAIAHIWLAGILLDQSDATALLAAVVFASAVSDVGAFFCGKYLGRHHLPAKLNYHKSWEGVVGQFVGALVGMILITQIVGVSVPLWLWLSVGFGSAAGDLMNSFIKRCLDIKDWGRAIPGHGGYLDRFASLSVAVALSVYSYVIFA
jgi:phosphatidate cytidylyltransferase